MDAALLLLLKEENRERREAYRKEKIYRKVLRDASNPMSLPNAIFTQYFRLNKEAFMLVLEATEPMIKQSSIPGILQLASCRRFFAEGGYQRAVRKDFDIGLARTTFCKIFANILDALESTLCSMWINLEMSEEEMRSSKIHFFENSGSPGVFGCVDGTHIKIIKPCTDSHLYYNRKGFYSINAMVICDHTMRIRAIDASHPGSSHDALIWSMTDARNYLLQKYRDTDCCSWILGDSGYSLEPFLMTPYRNPALGTAESRYNKKHSVARNIIERTIGNLKSRFRCLMGARQLNYSLLKASKIVNVCCALHNICKDFKLELATTDTDTEENRDDNIVDNEEFNNHNNTANIMRNSIANNM